MIRVALLVLPTLLMWSPGWAADAPTPPPVAPSAAAPEARTPEAAAEATVAARKTRDDPALVSLAKQDDPDPWLVADDLIRRGEYDAAEAFAKAAPRAAVEKLTDYVASRRRQPDDPLRRERLAKANAALGARNSQEALDAVGVAAQGQMDDVIGVRLAMVRGAALDVLGRLGEAHRAFLAAAEAAEQIGWRARASSAYDRAARSAFQCSAFAAARNAFEQAFAASEALGNRAGAATSLYSLGSLHLRLGKYDAALSCLERALATYEALEKRAETAWTLAGIGIAHYRSGDWVKALSFSERALSAHQALGNEAGAARALGTIGLVHFERGNGAGALAIYERALTVQEALGDRSGAAETLGNIGVVHRTVGDYAKALVAYERVLALFEALGDRVGAAMTLSNIASVRHELGDYETALALQERALSAQESLGNAAEAATILGNIGVVHHSLGDYRSALTSLKLSLAAKESLGDKAGAVKTLGHIGGVHYELGDCLNAVSIYESALAAQEALGDRAGAASTLRSIGDVYRRLGDDRKALSIYQRVFASQEHMGVKAEAARTLCQVANVYVSLGDYRRAMSTYERVVAAQDALGAKADAVRTLSGIGIVHGHLGDYPEALSVLERVLAAQEALGDKAGAASTLGNIGCVQHKTGDLASALSTHERALVAKEALGDRAGAALTLCNIGGVHLDLGDSAKAMMFARRAVEAQAVIARGLSAEEGVLAREPLSIVFEVGARAAVAENDAGALAYFLEEGRARALLEGLASREALWSAAVPRALRAEETKARAVEARAAAAVRKALDAGDLVAAEARRAEVDSASERVATVVGRIEREAKAGAAIVYPKSDSLDDFRAMLDPDDVLVVYALFANEAAALVVRRGGARIVTLGLRQPIDDAATAVVKATVTTEIHPDAVLSTLSDLVVKPLALAAQSKHVLVSPVGSLSYVPFAALMPGRTVVYVPSATTYRWLLEEESLRGDGVLALGDPDYTTKSNARALEVHRGAVARLAPLPGTREEVESIADVRLLAGQATEARLREALVARRRWRAVHLACHGLVNTDRPSLSSLALTASGDDDGFLTCLDVFRMKVPADLVVLSACETGRGKVVKSEGIVGLTRAFMFAGSPRVLCSLWKVDDLPTQLLMTKFYELWNPRDGAGLSASVALRQAQREVREHEIEIEDPASAATGQVRRMKVKPWAHPRYWAAWVLWGLP